MKLDADWKVKSIPELIEMLSKDLKRALYGEGNYRLYGKHKKNSFRRSVWKSFDEAQRKQKFSDFLEKKRKAEDESSYSTFPFLNTAKKPGQCTRIRLSKTLKKRKKFKKKNVSWQK